MRPDLTSPASPTAADTLKLRARVISSLVLAPGVLAAAWAGGPAFSGVIAAAGVILAREWTRMSDPEGGDQAFAMAAVGAAGAAIAAAALYMTLAWSWLAAAAVAAGVERYRRGGGATPAVAAALGVVYVAAPCAALVWLRLAPDGAERVTYLLGCVWAADTGAFFAGLLIGGPRLLPRVSAQKTWAGLIVGSLLAGLAGGALAWGFQWTNLAAKTLGAVALGAAALGGDLVESALKRRYGVKDAGALIPGHGGLLDRVDGLMLAAVVHATKVWIWP